MIAEATQLKESKVRGPRIRRASGATEELQEKIKVLWAARYSIEQIVDQYNIYPSIVEQIVEGTYETPARLGGTYVSKAFKQKKKKEFDSSSMVVIMEQRMDEYSQQISRCEQAIHEAEKQYAETKHQMEIEIQSIKGSKEYCAMVAFLRVLGPQAKPLSL